MAIHDQGRGPPETRRGAAPATEPHPRLLAKAASSALSITASLADRQARSAAVVPFRPRQAERRVELERRSARRLRGLGADLSELASLIGSLDGSVWFGPIPFGAFEAGACLRPQRGRR